MSKRNRKSFSNRSLSFESLEARQLMAADVSAVFQNGALMIAEGAGWPGGQNGVQVMQVAPGKMRVIGLQTDDGGVSLVNGHTSQDFTGVTSLFINLGGGNDQVVIGDLSNHNTTTRLADVFINVDGTNKFNAYSYDWDKVTVSNLVTTGTLDIRTGIGNDIVTVAKSTIGNNDLGNLNVYTGGGSDQINLTNVTVRGTAAIFSADSTGTAADSDLLSLQTVAINGGLQVTTGSGKDTLNATDVTAQEIIFDLGAGNDIANLNSVRAIDDFFARMGDGNDTLNETFLRANRLTLDGGAGTDSLTTGVDGTVGLFSKINWESINGKAPAPPFKKL